MKNLMGEEVEPVPMRLELNTNKNGIWIFRGQKTIGLVTRNGWNQIGCHINWPLEEPTLQSFSSNEFWSISELKEIVELSRQLKPVNKSLTN